MGLEELSGAEAKALFFAGGRGTTEKEKEGKNEEETLEARLARLEAENAALRARVGAEKEEEKPSSSASQSEEEERKRKKKEKDMKRKKKKDKEKNKKKKAAAAAALAPGTPQAASTSRPLPPPSDFDVSAWKGYGLCPQLLNALAEARLASPLPVQAATLPAALVARRDVLGAAPTGSGKTLAFGLAALQGLVDRGDVVPPAEREGQEGSEKQEDE